VLFSVVAALAAVAAVAIFFWPNDIDPEANNLRQSRRFDWEPPEAVLRDVRRLIGFRGG